MGGWRRARDAGGWAPTTAPNTSAEESPVPAGQRAGSSRWRKSSGVWPGRDVGKCWTSSRNRFSAANDGRRRRRRQRLFCWAKTADTTHTGMPDGAIETAEGMSGSYAWSRSAKQAEGAEGTQPRTSATAAFRVGLSAQVASSGRSYTHAREPNPAPWHLIIALFRRLRTFSQLFGDGARYGASSWGARHVAGAGSTTVPRGGR